MKKHKNNYCPKCGNPISIKAKFWVAFKQLSMIFFTLFLIWLILIIYNPEIYYFRWINVMFSFFANNLAGYFPNHELKEKDIEILKGDNYITEEELQNATSWKFQKMIYIADWVVWNIKYVDDVVFEDVQSPQTTLTKKFGDCEDKAILYCGLARQMGLVCNVKVSDNHAWSVVTYSNHNQTYCVWSVDPTDREWVNLNGGEENCRR